MTVKSFIMELITFQVVNYCNWLLNCYQEMIII